MDHEERIISFQEKLGERDLARAFLFYSRDIFYYTGTAQPSYLFVSPDDYTLFVKRGMDFTSREVFIDRSKMREERQLENVFNQISSKAKGKSIGTELDLMPANTFFEFRKIFKGYDLVDVSPIVLEQRKKKDTVEIDKLRQACKAIDMGHRAVLSNLQQGITELELAAAVENAYRLAGHEGMLFMRRPDFFMGTGPISSGLNLFRFSGPVFSVSGVGLSPAVPAGPSRKKIVKGDPVIIDMPTLVKGYHGDQTRTYVLGKSTKALKDLYERLKEICDCAIAGMRPGVKCCEIFQMANEKAEQLGVAGSFLSFGDGTTSHMIGHGIGLECTEPPILSKYDNSNIEEDYVMALEIHLTEKGVGVVKIEDMILIGRDKNEMLTKSPRDLFEVF